jgi:hypothetical protein
MPPQKNSGAKKSSRVSGVSKKNGRFIQEFMDELQAEGNVASIHVARVTRTMGNGRVEVYFISKNPDTSEVRGNLDQAIIRGSFRGRSKRDVWIDIGTIVAVADSGLKGSATLEIMAVFSQDQVRELRETVQYTPAQGRFKIYIIDEVHMLSTAAFNALLKTLEEPPAHVKFLAPVTGPQGMLST